MANESAPPPKVIREIQVGAAELDKVGWTFTYQDGAPESFALHLPIAKQFLAALGQCVTALEQAQAPPGGTASRMGIREEVQVSLSPPSA